MSPRVYASRMTSRRIILASLTCALAAPVLADTYPRQTGVDILHYAFRLNLSDESDVIEGETAVTFRVQKAGLTLLTLDLIRQRGAGEKGMSVTAVSENGKELKFQHPLDKLQIPLDPPGKVGESRTFTIRYKGTPATGLKIAPTRHGERSFFSDNWPIKARHWLPTLDHPGDKATAEMIVTAPSHYQVVSNGVLVEEIDLEGGRRRTHWKQNVPMSTWLNTLGVARFAVDHRPAWRGIPVDTWVYRQDRDNGFERFTEPTRAVLDFFSENVGPYPFERLGHVQASSVSGGMESATSIFYGEGSVDDPKGTRWRNVIVHEIAHQWFGNAVTENDWDHVWLSEGFATYFTHLFIEHRYGREEFIAGLRADRDAVFEFDGKSPNYRIVHNNLADMEQVVSGPGTYRKGAWVLHMLRGVVGNDTFWRGIRDYYERFSGKTAATDDFKDAMERASGQELKWFFDQWLMRGGHPVVRAKWGYDEESKTVRLDLEQTQKGVIFRLPIDVAIETEGVKDPRVERIEMTERKQHFRFEADKDPRGVFVDPRMFVLMELVSGESSRTDR